MPIISFITAIPIYEYLYLASQHCLAKSHLKHRSIILRELTKLIVSPSLIQVLAIKVLAVGAYFLGLLHIVSLFDGPFILLYRVRLSICSAVARLHQIRLR